MSKSDCLHNAILIDKGTPSYICFKDFDRKFQGSFFLEQFVDAASESGNHNFINCTYFSDKALFVKYIRDKVKVNITA